MNYWISLNVRIFLFNKVLHRKIQHLIGRSSFAGKNFEMILLPPFVFYHSSNSNMCVSTTVTE